MSSAGNARARAAAPPERRRVHPVVWLTPVLAAAYAVAHWSNPVALAADSAGYLNFFADRSAGYPLFRDAVLALFDGNEAVAKTQLVLAAAAFTFLGWSVHRAFGFAFPALLLLLLLIDHDTLGGLHALIMTESTFATLLCVMAGGLALLARRPRWQWAALSATACGLAIMVRPAAISLLPLWPIALWFLWEKCAGQRARLLAAVVFPLLICLIAENAVWDVKHDAGIGDRPVLANRHVFAKALVLEPEPAVDEPDLAAVVERGRAELAPGRALIADAPDLQARTLLLRNFEVAAQHQTYARVLAEEMGALAQRRGVTESELQGAIGWDAMLAAPGDWLGNALTHWWGLWSGYWLSSGTFVARYEAYTEGLEDGPLFEDARVFELPVEAASWPPRERLASILPGVESLDWLPTVNGTRWKLGAGLVASALGIALASWRRIRWGSRDLDGRLVVAALAGLAVHGHFLLIGLVGVATPRYAEAVWPLMALCIALMVSWALSQARGWAWPRSPARGTATR